MTRAEDLMICHQCDFAGCTNAAHMRLGTNTTNRAEYFERRGNLAGTLADVRGAAGARVPSPPPFEPGWPTTKTPPASRNESATPKSLAFPSRSGDGQRRSAVTLRHGCPNCCPAPACSPR